jgi:EpsD family peptidyl-prolyl cis-trans isomerase
MRTKLIYGLVPVACLTLSACDMFKGKPKDPTGQVVAVVDGDEITVTELRAELAGFNTSDPKARKAAEQQALQAIINRKIVANAAEEQKLDKTPEFALQEQRAMESLRATALQKKIVDAVPEPTREEANRFMEANPDLFAQRKIFAIDQIRMQRPSDPAVIKDLEPLQTLEEVEAMLKAKGVAYQKGADAIDAVGSNPQLIQAIVKLPANEVFVIPSGQLVLINRVRETRVQPFTGEPAVKYATNVLKAQRTREALQRQFGGLIQQAQSTIRYNKLYEPPKPAAKTKAPAAPAASPKV